MTELPTVGADRVANIAIELVIMVVAYYSLAALTSSPIAAFIGGYILGSVVAQFAPFISDSANRTSAGGG